MKNKQEEINAEYFGLSFGSHNDNKYSCGCAINIHRLDVYNTNIIVFVDIDSYEIDSVRYRLTEFAINE
jgi:hypothetical protein